MGVFDALRVSATGLQAERTRMDVIAEKISAGIFASSFRIIFGGLSLTLRRGTGFLGFCHHFCSRRLELMRYGCKVKFSVNLKR